MPGTVFILNGPNLNLLGMREPEIYGSTTLAEIEAQCAEVAGALGLDIDFRQSNHEGDLIDWMHEAQNKNAKAILINAAAYTHTSIALLDAAKAIQVPVIEIHLSDPHTREEFRHVSYIGKAAQDTVQGMGPGSYTEGLQRAARL